jgi:hypothetical protein
MTQIARHSIIVVAVIGASAVSLAGPPMPQPLAYHDMADQRSLLGIPNALNVLSNLPFAIVGVLGLATVFESRVGRGVLFEEPWERWRTRRSSLASL